jgi:hypothetical protein
MVATKAPVVLCVYPDREHAEQIVRRVCDTNCAHAQVIAKQHDGIAYRLRPACPPPVTFHFVSRAGTLG